MFEGVVFTGNDISRIGWNMSTIKSTKEMFKDSDFTGGPYVNAWFAGSNVLEDASGMFEGATKFNEHIGAWNMSGVTNLSNMFKNTVLFNSYIANWDVSSVTDASGMFEGSQAFQKVITAWNWAALKNASSMFKNSTYKGYISPWFKSPKVLEDASNMFEGVSFSGNQINALAWNMSTVKSTKEMFKNSDFTGGGYMNAWFSGSNVLENASGMFEGTTHFNRPIGNWDVTSLKDGSKMFKNSVFNQVITDWSLDSAENLDEMFFDNSVFNKWIGTWQFHLNKVKSKENFDGSHPQFNSPNFNRYPENLTANVSVNGLLATVTATLSDNLDFWTYELNNGDEVISNSDSQTLVLDPGNHNIKVHAYATTLSGSELRDSLKSTFSITEEQISTSGFLPSKLTTLLG